MNRPRPKNIKLNRLYSYLESQSLTFADFGAKIGYSRGYVSKILKGQRPISQSLLIRILKQNCGGKK